MIKQETFFFIRLKSELFENETKGLISFIGTDWEID